MNLKSQPKKKKTDQKICILHFYEVLEYLICGDRNQNSSLLRVGVRIDSKGALGNWWGDGNVLSLDLGDGHTGVYRQGCAAARWNHQQY